MYKPPGYWHHTATQIELDALKRRYDVLKQLLEDIIEYFDGERGVQVSSQLQERIDKAVR